MLIKLLITCLLWLCMQTGCLTLDPISGRKESWTEDSKYMWNATLLRHNKPWDDYLPNLVTSTPPHTLPRHNNKPWEDHLSNLVTSTPPHTQEEAVKELIGRLLPNHRNSFVIEVDPNFTEDKKDIFKIVSPRTATDSRVGIKGTTGVAVSWGLMHYLKYFCGAHVSWEANQLDLPQPLPKAHVKIVALDRLHYYQNVCTVSYSFAWWNWAKWERHIDWMALNGINFALAFTAQEEIWRRVYAKFNFSEHDLDDHFVGPAFLAWGRMGNIQKWMGPLRPDWHKKTLTLQHLIIRQMRRFGMIPILPAFAGHVPSAITRIFPDSRVTQLSAWGKFKNPNYTRTFMLDPRDKLFPQIGVAFIKEMEKEFNGTDHVYNCDSFNEMLPPSFHTKYLRSVGKAIFNAMTLADPKTIWVMQGWLFRNPLWTPKAAKALLTSVPQGRMVVLDLTAEVDPQYSRLRSFFGQPFIFCMLHNYGGVNGFYGNAGALLQRMSTARSYTNVTMVGTGLTPEGINQNYVIYDLMLELSWRREKINLTQWSYDYSDRRYGCRSALLRDAWGTLMNSVYNCKEDKRFHGNGILIQHRPDLTRRNFMWYSETDLFWAWEALITASYERDICEKGSEEDLLLTVGPLEAPLKEGTTLKGGKEVEGSGETDTPISPLRDRPTFKHDLLDVTRQVLQVVGGNLIEDLRSSYHLNASANVSMVGDLLLDLFDDLDLLLGTSKDFLLGAWLRDASEWASDEQERNQYLANARYQVTLWGPNGEIVDYAVKQWNGLVKHYMKPRWALFLATLLKDIQNGTKFDNKKFKMAVFSKVEKPFADGRNHLTYPRYERGNFHRTVRYIHDKYCNSL